MNLGQLRTAVDRRTGIAFDPAATTEVLNEALQQVSTEKLWEWLETVWRPAMVAGQASYPLPYGTTSVRSIAVDGWEIPHAHIENVDGDFSWVGWVVEAEQLVVSPTPSGGETVVVRITQTDGPLAQDADTPLLPEEWHVGALVNLAASIILERLDEFQRADRRKKEYDATVRRMKRTARRGRGPIAAKVRPGGGL